MSDINSHKKPRSSIPFLPDPSKWIQTSGPSSTTKRPISRPLVGFKNTFHTPPTTIKRREPTTNADHHAGQFDTPTNTSESSRQGLLNAFLTPPATFISKRQSNQPDASQSGSRTAGKRGDSPVKKVARSKLAIRLDDDSTSSGVEGRPSVRPLQSHRSAPVTSSSSGMSDALDQVITPIRQKKKRRRTLTSSPSPPLFEHAHGHEGDHGETPTASHVSSDRPITPVPDYVLDIHRRLCGRDTERMNRVKSPWRTTPKHNLSPTTKQPTPVPALITRRSRMEDHKRHDVDVRAHDQALVRRRKKQDRREQENIGVQLVKGSSQVEVEEGTPKKRKRDRDVGQVLSPRVINASARRARPVSPTIGAKSPRRRDQVLVGQGKSERMVPDLNVEQAISVESGPLAVYQAFRVPSPRIRTPRKLKRAPTGTSPRSAIPLASPSPSPAPITHHNSTPPKDVTETKRSSSLIMTSPDLGDFVVSRQPIFTRSPSKVQDFKPVSMDAETLMTWSLGPQARPRPQHAASGSGTGSGSSPQRPDPRPLQSHASQKQDTGETQTQSLAPSATSQSFPNLLLSPTRPRPAEHVGPNCADGAPTCRPISTARPSVVFPETMRRSTVLDSKQDLLGSRKAPSLARFPTNLGVAETLHAGSPSANKGKSPAKSASRVGRTSMSEWPSTGFGLEDFTSPAKNNGSPTTSHTPKSKRKGRDSVSNSDSGARAKQPKLASFGFFSDKPQRPVRGFDQEWDQEEDLALDMDMEGKMDGQSPSVVDRNESRAERSMGMGVVPEAPPHPDLRPAGLRELKRRREEQERLNTGSLESDGNEQEDREVEDEKPLFPEASTSSQVGLSTDDQSSLTTDDDLGMNGSVVAWYEGLEDRRSSEFGSVSEV